MILTPRKLSGTFMYKLRKRGEQQWIGYSLYVPYSMNTLWITNELDIVRITANLQRDMLEKLASYQLPRR